jgi:hypothetical protein
MIRMHVCGGYRLCGVGMLWRGGVILGSFATAFMPLRPFILESYFDAFAQGLLRTSSLASPEHCATDLKQETSLAPFTIRQERQITCLLYDLAQESHGVLKELAFLASTVPVPQKRVARSINTIVHPCDSSGATFCLTLVYSASPAISCCRNWWVKANNRSVFLHYSGALASDRYYVCSHHTAVSQH